MNINTNELPLLINRLKNAENPIVMYGMGNGGDKILDLCITNGIKISGVFASDNFVRKKTFRGFSVMSYSETKETFGSTLTILLAFASSRPEVLKNIYRIANENTLLAPDVPAFGSTIFSEKFFKNNENEFQKVYQLLRDERSRELYRDVIKYKLTGEIEYLKKADNEVDYMDNIILSSKIRHFVDAGAYKGDTASTQIKYSPELKSIIAIEPDPKTYEKMFENLKDIPNIDITAVNSGLWKEEAILPFSGDGGRGGNATLGVGNKTASFNSLDNIIGERPVDYIKYDVEGMEYEALLGSKETIRRNSPFMLVSLYHRSEDLFRLPLLVKELMPNSRFYLRRLAGIPAWDLNLLVVPE